MRSRILPLIAGCAAAVLTCLFVAPEVEACSCAPSICSSQAEYDAVFEATVDALVPPSARPDGMMVSSDLMTVRLRDLRIVRGEARDEVVTPQSGALCGYTFRVGTRYLIFARRSTGDGRLHVSACGLTRPSNKASGMIRYLESLSAPSKGGRVWGRVAMPSPSTGVVALASMHVALSGAYSTETITDAAGEFEFVDLPPGSYTVTVSAPDQPEFSFPTHEARLDEAYACSEMVFWPRMRRRGAPGGLSERQDFVRSARSRTERRDFSPGVTTPDPSCRPFVLSRASC